MWTRNPITMNNDKRELVNNPSKYGGNSMNCILPMDMNFYEHTKNETSGRMKNICRKSKKHYEHLNHLPTSDNAVHNK